MKQKLKKSFVKITMVSAILVLALLMGIVNLANAVERRYSSLFGSGPPNEPISNPQNIIPERAEETPAAS